ncbi:NFACT RNA binding domain-containing protein [Deferribacter thermophilus]|uniref:NFACT RNA binding domain-containing protein n=1 Tax=Deferribacter thermophilus TaxID=53573 RepID=UPI003C27250C
MDGLTLYKLLYNYNEILLKSRINSCEYSKDQFILNIYSSTKLKQLIIDLNNPIPLQLTDKKFKLTNRIEYLSNSSIKEIKQKGFDRAFYLTLLKRKPSGKLIKYKIIFELVGKMSNVIITNENGRIIFCWNNNNIDTDRELSNGKLYTPFKSNKKFNLTTSENCKFENFEGFYSITEKHAYNLLKINNNDCYKTKQLILESLKSKYFYIDKNGRLIPFEIPDYHKLIPIEKLYDFLLEKSNNDSIYPKKLKITKYYEKQIKKNENLIKKLKEDLKLAYNFSKYKEEADLLKNNLNILKDKKGEVKLKKYTENGIEEIDYIIDENINIIDKINKLYNKAEKLKRSIPIIEERINNLIDLNNFYNEMIFNIESDDENFIEEIYSSLFNKTKKNIKHESAPKYLILKKGNTIFYVGKNSKSNQFILFKLANPDDYWFHAHEIPSAHLIMRATGEITDEDIITAARIVAHYSKYKNELKVPIDYTKRKYVKKPKNTPEGFVIYNNYKTIYVPPFDENDIKKLLIEN